MSHPVHKATYIITNGLHFTISIKMCPSRLLLPTLAVLLTLFTSASGCGRGRIHIKDNEYRDMLIAIDPSVPEDYSIVERLQEIFTNASAYLFRITRHRAYFGDITILVPESWTDNAQFESKTTEAIDKSDILVDIADDRFTQSDRPFVIKTTPCGQLGHYMHLTPRYVLNNSIAQLYGPYEKAIIHEWAHLRYGVFNEYPDEKTSQNFFAAANGEIEGIRCSSAIQGRFYDIVEDREGCNYENGLPDKDCRFLPDTEGIQGEYGSIMFSQQLEHITEFCDNDEASPLTLHNRQANTKQNQMCDGRSVWEVLREHGDFEKGFNPPVNVSSTVPRFRLVKESFTRRTVLVLDTSGSMRDNGRLGRLARAAYNYIMQVVQDGEEVGVVWFSGSATIRSGLQKVNATTRRTLLDHIPTWAGGSTSIGDGLLKGMDVLNNQTGTILLLSDGYENADPRISDILPRLTASKVTVDTVAVGAADSQLETVAQMTGGTSFYVSDSDNSNAFNEAFLATADQQRSSRSKTIPLVSESFLLAAGDTRSDVIYIDSTIGAQIDVIISYNVTAPIVALVTPGGHVIDPTSPEYTNDATFNTSNIHLVDLSETGAMTLTMTNPQTDIQLVTVTVTSRVRTQELSPIITHAQWRLPSVTFPDNQMLYVSVSRGVAPILLADVSAMLEQPGELEGEVYVTNLQLRDNGAGADVTLNDGVYSGFVTKFTANGRYTVRVRVEGGSDTVVDMTGIIGIGASMPRDIGIMTSSDKVERFQRIATAGSFSLAEFLPDMDMYPPCQITDLSVSGVGHRRVTLEWTAPGDDLDTGRASAYELWMSTEFTNLYENHTETTPVTETQLEGGSLNQPQHAGDRESVTVALDRHGDVTFFFTLLTVDDAGNRAPRSNIVSASMKHVPIPSDVSAAMIAGIAVAASVILLLLVVLVVIAVRRKRNRGFLFTIRRKYSD